VKVSIIAFMYILGISAFYHDSAVALLKDGEIIYAAQEERFTRKKHDSDFPEKALINCLESSGITSNDLDYVVFYEKPLLKFDRLMSTYMQFSPRGIKSFLKAIPVWVKHKIFIKEIIKQKLNNPNLKVLFTTHHESHTASAFFPSPFKEAAIITIDGVGEWETLTISKGKENNFETYKRILFPHSLGLLYSAFTYFTGFKVNSGEYKLMGLAPYGEPKYKQIILDELIDIKDDGSFRLNLKYFNYHIGLTMTNKKFEKLFGIKRRLPEAKIRIIDMDIAASVQSVLEDVIEKIVKNTKKMIDSDNLCLAGGVALNCVANGKILKEQIFKNIWIQPAAGDAGGALGAALYLWFKEQKNQRKINGKDDSQQGSFLGPSYSEEKIRTFLNEKKINFVELKREKMPREIARLMNEQNVIGFFQGKMEFGPRALGGRSIIADPRSPEMQSKLNLKIKFRESFRPFAPSILEEKVDEYFNFNHPSPYMLLVYNIHDNKKANISAEEKSKKGLEKLSISRSEIPAITHVDFSARVHSVNKEKNSYFYDVINEFYKLTDCPVIINTSFNVRGEPIVNTPEDAYQCFMRTNMDYLILENFLIEKKKQDVISVDEDWMKEFTLD